MELAWFVYAADVFGSFKNLCVVVSIVLAIILFCIVGALCSEGGWGDSDVVSIFKPICKILSIMLGVVTMLAIFIPSEKTTYMMLGGYAAQNVLESGTADKVKQIIDKKLDEYLKEEKK